MQVYTNFLCIFEYFPPLLHFLYDWLFYSLWMLCLNSHIRNKRSTHHIRTSGYISILIYSYCHIKACNTSRHRKVNYLARNYFRHTAFIIVRCQPKWQWWLKVRWKCYLRYSRATKLNDLWGESTSTNQRDENEKKK